MDHISQFSLWNRHEANEHEGTKSKSTSIIYGSDLILGWLYVMANGKNTKTDLTLYRTV
jgi:hypothetical protein